MPCRSFLLSRPGQQGACLLFLCADFVDVGLKFGQLGFELLAVLPSTPRKLRNCAAVSRGLSYMSIISLASVSFRPEPLGAQRELQARTVARGVDGAPPARALGREQAHVLVEADRARGEVELLGEFADGEGLVA